MSSLNSSLRTFVRCRVGRITGEAGLSRRGARSKNGSDGLWRLKLDKWFQYVSNSPSQWALRSLHYGQRLAAVLLPLQDRVSGRARAHCASRKLNAFRCRVFQSRLWVRRYNNYMLKQNSRFPYFTSGQQSLAVPKFGCLSSTQGRLFPQIWGLFRACARIWDC